MCLQSKTDNKQHLTNSATREGTEQQRWTQNDESTEAHKWSVLLCAVVWKERMVARRLRAKSEMLWNNKLIRLSEGKCYHTHITQIQPQYKYLIAAKQQTQVTALSPSSSFLLKLSLSHTHTHILLFPFSLSHRHCFPFQFSHTHCFTSPSLLGKFYTWSIILETYEAKTSCSVLIHSNQTLFYCILSDFFIHFLYVGLFFHHFIHEFIFAAKTLCQCTTIFRF